METRNLNIKNGTIVIAIKDIFGNRVIKAGTKAKVIGNRKGTGVDLLYIIQIDGGTAHTVDSSEIKVCEENH